MANISVKGYGMILVAAVLFGTYGVWSRLMGDTFPLYYQAWVRSVLVIMLMIPFMLANKSFRKIHKQDWPALGLFITFCVFTQAPLYYAFNNAPIGTVQLIFYSMFVVTAYVVGRVYLGETITKVKLASIVLAIVGLALVFGTAVIAFAPLGLGLAMLNGVASGGEVSSSKKLTEKYPPTLIVFWGWLFTVLTHLPLSLTLGEEQVPIRFDQAWLWLLAYAVANALAFWLIVAGFKYVDASIGSLIGLTEVFFGVVFGAIFFDEILSPTTYAGGLVIITAAMLPDLINIVEHRRRGAETEPVREI